MKTCTLNYSASSTKKMIKLANACVNNIIIIIRKEKEIEKAAIYTDK